jgi:hypothetical protein
MGLNSFLRRVGACNVFPRQTTSRRRGYFFLLSFFPLSEFIFLAISATSFGRNSANMLSTMPANDAGDCCGILGSGGWVGFRGREHFAVAVHYPSVRLTPVFSGL